MKHFTLCACLLPTVLSLGLVAPSAHAAVIYREIFGTTVTDPGAVQESVLAAGWSALRDDGSTQYPALNAYNGMPTNLGSVNADTDAPHEVQDRGFVNVRYNTSPYTYLIYTGEKSVDRTTLNANDVTFSWYQAADMAGFSTRLAIKIASQWYVSDETFSNTQTASLSTFSTKAQQHSIQLDDADGFHALTVVAGSGGSITMAPAKSLLPNTGDLVAFGLWTDSIGTSGSPKASRFMMDTYQIDTTPLPEPAALSLLGAASVLLLKRRRHVQSA